MRSLLTLTTVALFLILGLALPLLCLTPAANGVCLPVRQPTDCHQQHPPMKSHACCSAQHLQPAVLPNVAPSQVEFIALAIASSQHNAATYYNRTARPFAALDTSPPNLLVLRI